MLDLRGRPSADQIRAAQAGVDRVADGAAVQIVTDLDIVATMVLAAAAGRGLQGRVEPPADGARTMTISPGNRPDSEIPAMDKETIQ